MKKILSLVSLLLVAMMIFAVPTFVIEPDAVYVATSALISIGCKVCQSCSEGICPKGIATQERMLRRRLDPIRKGQQVANYIEAMTQEVTSLTQQAGNTDIENLEREDLVALTMEASQLTGVPMVSKQH